MESQHFHEPHVVQRETPQEKPILIKRRKIPVLFLPSTFGSGEVSVTDDGKTIYFVSDKRRGYGGTDIYMSHQKNLGDGVEP